jgi:cell division transport system permease protein
LLLFYIGFKNFKIFVNEIKNNTTVIVYLKKDADSLKIEEFKSILNNKFKINNIKHYSSENALNELIISYPQIPQLVEGLPENPLPQYIEVEFYEINETVYKNLEQLFSEYDFVEDYDLGLTIYNDLKKIEFYLYNFFLITGFILCIFCIFIIYSIIRLTVYIRRKEIEIQKIIGAAPFFIRLPYLIESFFLMLKSIIISFLLSYFIFDFIKIKIYSLYNFNFQIRFFDINEMIIILIVVLILAVTGTFKAVSGFLCYDIEQQKY